MFFQAAKCSSGNRQTEVEIYNPRGWYILTWPDTASTWGFGIPPTITKTGVPKYCENLGWDKCICICDGDFQDDCDDKGYCLKSEDYEIITPFVRKSIEIDPIPLKLNLEGNKIFSNIK